MRPVNQFLLDNNIRISHNPCISPDFCLDWRALATKVKNGGAVERPNTRFETAAGTWTLLEDEATCDCAWKLRPAGDGNRNAALEDGVTLRAVAHGSLRKLGHSTWRMRRCAKRMTIGPLNCAAAQWTLCAP